MTAQMMIYSEKREVVYELLSGGRPLASALGLSLAAVILGDGGSVDAEECFRYGAERIYVADNPHLAEFVVERVAEALHQIMVGNAIEVVLIGSTRRGKELAGRLAQKVEAGCVTDAISLAIQDGQLVTERYALGGNTVSTEVLRTGVKVIAVMPRTFEAVVADEGRGEALPVELDLAPPRVTVVERRAKGGEGVNIEEAEVLVGIGRGLEKKEDLSIVQDLADALRGELGCSRSLSSDYGWLSEERMIGISGKKCSPRLHVSVGISGQIQHTVGIMGSKIIVAINKDKSAPIFKIADYGVVGDLYEVVPKLAERLRRRERR